MFKYVAGFVAKCLYCDLVFEETVKKNMAKLLRKEILTFGAMLLSGWNEGKLQLTSPN